MVPPPPWKVSSSEISVKSIEEPRDKKWSEKPDILKRRKNRQSCHENADSNGILERNVRFCHLEIADSNGNSTRLRY